MSTPKKHHFVPRLLLRRFADDNEALRVHRLDPTTDYLSNVTDVGHQVDGHTLYLPDGTPDRTTLEEAMSRIEGAANEAIDELQAGADPNDGTQHALSWFFALQWTRSRYLLDSLGREVDRRDATPQEFQTSILRATLFPLLAAYSLQDSDTARPKETWDFTQSALSSKSWTVCRYREGSLITGDQTVCLSGTRPPAVPGINAAWTRHGIGVGVADAARVTAALSHNLGILMTSVPPRSRLPAARFNRTTIYNARRFVTHHPDWPHAHKRSFDQDLYRQRMLAPVFYTNQF